MESAARISYEVDGIVVKINDLKLAESLGFVGKDPRGATALKFQAQEVSTRLKIWGECWQDGCFDTLMRFLNRWKSAV